MSAWLATPKDATCPWSAATESPPNKGRRRMMSKIPMATTTPSIPNRYEYARKRTELGYADRMRGGTRKQGSMSVLYRASDGE